MELKDDIENREQMAKEWRQTMTTIELRINMLENENLWSLNRIN